MTEKKQQGLEKLILSLLLHYSTISVSCTGAEYRDRVEWLTIPLHIREDPGSNLSPETGYPD
jgi:hypothetical protein